MQDKAKLGNRYTCFECGCKFYDLNREIPSCPQCSADQRNAPVRDIKSLLSKSGRRAAAPAEEFESDREEVEEEDEDIGLLGDIDGDSDDDDDDDDEEEEIGGEEEDY